MVAKHFRFLGRQVLFIKSKVFRFGCMQKALHSVSGSTFTELRVVTLGSVLAVNTGGSYSQGGGSEGSWIVEAKSQGAPFEEGRR